ncbi:MAG: hypothetical protein ACE5J2_03770 [Nitrososphaerales archaeon]
MRNKNENHSSFKVLNEEDTGHILGVHILSPNAEEVISIFAMAIRLGLHATDLKSDLCVPNNLIQYKLHGIGCHIIIFSESRITEGIIENFNNK